MNFYWLGIKIHLIFVFLQKVYYLFFSGKPYNIDLTFYILICSSDLFQFDPISFWNFLTSITFMASLIFLKTFGILFYHFYFHCVPDIFLYEHGLIGALVTIFQFYSILIWFFQKLYGHFYFHLKHGNYLYEQFLIWVVVPICSILNHFLPICSDFFEIFFGHFYFYFKHDKFLF